MAVLEPTAARSPVPDPDPEVEGLAVASADVSAHVKGLPRDRARASDVLVLRALRLLRRGDIGVAEELLSKATQLDRKNPRAMVATAELYLAQDNPTQALPLAERAASMRSRRSQYHVILGDALAGTGDAEGAKAAWQMALRKDRGNKDARARLQALKQ